MARKHAFFIVVLLAAAALAGFAVFARSAEVPPASANATPALSESALEARLRELDRFEAKLRKQLAAKPPVRNAVPATVITQAAAAPAAAYEDEDEDEDEGEEHEEDDD